MPKKFPAEFKRDVVRVARRGDLIVSWLTRISARSANSTRSQPEICCGDHCRPSFSSTTARDSTPNAGGHVRPTGVIHTAGPGRLLRVQPTSVTSAESRLGTPGFVQAALAATGGSCRWRPRSPRLSDRAILRVRLNAGLGEVKLGRRDAFGRDGMRSRLRR